MPDLYDNLDEVLSQLESIGMRTTQGTFVKVEDVKKLLKDRLAVKAQEVKDESDTPKPKNFHEAKKAIRADKELMEGFKSVGPRDAGRAIPATETKSA